MADIAILGLAVEYSNVKQATITLHQLTGAAGAASTAAQRLAGASQAEAAGQRAATAATQVHTAALHANNAAMRMGNQVRTNMIYQLNDVGVSLASGMSPIMVAIQQLPQMLQFGLKPAIESIVGIGRGLLTTFSPVLAIVGGLTLLLKGLTDEINAVDGANVSMMDTALAVFQSISDGIQTTLAPAFTWLSGEFKRATAQIFSDTAREVNAVIGLLVGAVDAIKAVWGQLPDALGYIAFEASRNVVNAIVRMVQDVQASINDLIGGFNLAMLRLGSDMRIPTFDLEKTRESYILGDNPYQSAGSAVDAAGTAFTAAQGQDYVGDWMQGIGARAQEIAAARAETEALGGAASAANDNVKKLADDGLTKVAEFAKSVLSTLGSGFKDLFKAVVFGTKSAGEAIGELLGKLGDLFLDNAFNMLFGGMATGGVGMGGGIGGWLGSLFGFANGGVFNAGHQVQAFAQGGVVNRPTLFPMANGAGLMGEAGPEAIMPLRRGPDGRLGVSAANQNQANDNGGTIEVKGTFEVVNGNMVPVITEVSGRVAGKMLKPVSQAVGKIQQQGRRY